MARPVKIPIDFSERVADLMPGARPGVQDPATLARLRSERAAAIWRARAAHQSPPASLEDQRPVLVELSRPPSVLSHWLFSAEDLNASALELYDAVEAALRARQVPGVSFSRVLQREGGLLSARREYLRVRRERLAFDIGAAPFGRTFFVSVWLRRLRYRDTWLHRLVRPRTRHYVDIECCFQLTVWRVLQEVVREAVCTSGRIHRAGPRLAERPDWRRASAGFECRAGRKRSRTAEKTRPSSNLSESGNGKDAKGLGQKSRHFKNFQKAPS